MLSLPFIHHALLAGTAIALLSRLAGYFVVLRGQVFTGDMLSHVAYAGALAALAAGLEPRIGLFASTIAVAVGIAVLAGKATADDVIIGNAMAWALGLGVFFLAFYTTYRATETPRPTSPCSSAPSSAFPLTMRPWPRPWPPDSSPSCCSSPAPCSLPASTPT